MDGGCVACEQGEEGMDGGYGLRCVACEQGEGVKGGYGWRVRSL